MDKSEMLSRRLDGQSYTQIATLAGISRQRVQQILSPPAAVRNIVVQRYAGRCGDCGVLIGRQGHVHHKGSTNGDTYNDLENLELLCCSCHRQKHGLEHGRNKQQVQIYIDQTQKPVYQAAKAQAFLRGMALGDYVIEALRAKMQADSLYLAAVKVAAAK